MLPGYRYSYCVENKANRVNITLIKQAKWTEKVKIGEAYMFLKNLTCQNWLKKNYKTDKS